MGRFQERAGLSPRDGWILAGIMLVGLAIRVAYVLLTLDQPLRGDAPEYHLQGSFLADGKWFWSTTPYGIEHPSLWKAPGYVLWVGGWYALRGAPDPDVVRLAQAFIGPLVIGLTFLIGRRLFSPAVGLAAAGVVAIYPFTWQFEVLLYSEALALPLTLLVLLLVLDREPSLGRAVVVGALMGAGLLLRPSAVFLFGGIAVSWLLIAGLRRGAGLTAVALAVAVICVAPWTYRNYVVDGGFVPISVQDAALFGTFNDDAANDPTNPYVWRPSNSRDADLFDPEDPLRDSELRAELQERSRAYIREHPASVAEAFFWNGLSRLWDIRRPARALVDPRFEGRTQVPSAVGLAMYWVLLALALATLWRIRRRRQLVLPVLALALAASVVFIGDAGTRYRAPLEPLIVVLACSTPAIERMSRRLRGERPTLERAGPEPAGRPAAAPGPVAP